MSTHAPATVSAEELLKLPRGEGKRYELIEGRLHMMCAAGFDHGRVAMMAGSLLTTHVQATSSGVTLGAETGFILARGPDTVRAPDAAFVSSARADAVGPSPGFWPGGAPDLAIEVVSPDDSRPSAREGIELAGDGGNRGARSPPPFVLGDRVPRGRRRTRDHRRRDRPERRRAGLAGRARRLLHLSRCRLRDALQLLPAGASVLGFPVRPCAGSFRLRSDVLRSLDSPGTALASRCSR